jgi:hypothetical protein
LVDAGREVVTEVAEGVFERAEDPVVGEIDEFLGEAFEEGVSLDAQGREELLAPRFTFLRGRRSSRRGIVQHGNLPGFRSATTGVSGSNFPRRSQSTKPARISHLLLQSTPARLKSQTF